MQKANALAFVGRHRSHLLEQSGLEEGPDGIAALVSLADGSIGRALSLAEAGGAALSRDVDRFLSTLPGVDGEALHAFAGKTSRRPKEGESDVFATTTALMMDWIDRTIRTAATGGASNWVARIGVEEAFRRRAAFARLIRLEPALNLDRKQVILDGVHALMGIGLDHMRAAE